MDKPGEYCYEASQSIHINVARKLGIERYIGGVWEYGTQQIYVDINSCTYTKDEDEIESIIYNSKIYRLLNSMYQVDDILIEDTLDDVDESITQNSEEYYKSITLSTSKWRKNSGKNVDVFKNPSKQEIAKLFREFGDVRYLFDNDLYVWDSEGLHYDIWKEPEMLDKFKEHISPDGISVYYNNLKYENDEELEKRIEDFLNNPNISRLGYDRRDIKLTKGWG